LWGFRRRRADGSHPLPWQGRSVDWAYEAYYWRNAALGIGAGLAFNAWVLCLRRRRREMAREPVPPPAPERQPGRRGRRARRN